jgi:hypothetical protein
VLEVGARLDYVALVERRRPWSSLVLLGCSLALLASLYLPWQAIDCRSATAPCGPASGFDGWSAGLPVALAALALAGLALGAWARPGRVGPLPLALFAVLSGYLAFGVAVLTRSLAHRQKAATPGLELHHGSGLYLGLAAGVLLLLAAAATIRSRPGAAAVLLLVAGLLVAFLLPWRRFVLGPEHETGHGIGLASASIAAALALLLAALPMTTSPAARPWRLPLAVAVAVFTAAGLGKLAAFTTSLTAAWIGVGLALALVVVAALERPRQTVLDGARWPALATAAGTGLYLASLFLPWQEACYPSGGAPAQLGIAGRCVSTDGWRLETSVAGLLALGLVVLAYAPGLLAAAPVELAAGVGLLVATAGTQLEWGRVQSVRLDVGAGAFLGFVAAGVLVVLALAALRTRAPARPLALAPAAVSLVYVAVVVLPWWGVLPDRTWSTFSRSLAALSWQTVAEALVGIRLVRLWVDRAAGGTRTPAELVILPLALAALAALDAIRVRELGLTRNTPVLVGLPALLLAFGVVERAGGIRGLRVPELFRIDRI